MLKLKLGNIRVILPNFQHCARCEKCLKDNKHNYLHFARKYTRTFVLVRYLILEAHSFSRATLSENCSLLGTDNPADRYPCIFLLQMGLLNCSHIEHVLQINNIDTSSVTKEY